MAVELTAAVGLVAATASDGVGLRLRFLATGACCGDNELACDAAAVGDAPPPKPLLNVLRADGGDLIGVVVGCKKVE